MKEQKKKSSQPPARPRSTKNLHQEQEDAQAAGPQAQNTKWTRENKHKQQASQDAWARDGTPSSSSPEGKGNNL